jgi:hypothetical protein
MHWGYNWQPGWFFGMHLLWWVFWIGMLAVCAWSFSRWVGPASGAGRETPLDVLWRRLCGGSDHRRGIRGTPSSAAGVGVTP